MTQTLAIFSLSSEKSDGKIPRLLSCFQLLSIWTELAAKLPRDPFDDLLRVPDDFLVGIIPSDKRLGNGHRRRVFGLQQHQLHLGSLLAPFDFAVRL